MNEVKTPKKPLIFYYGIAMVVLLLLNMLVMPLITQQRVEEVDYGTFIKMTENKEIGQVEIEENQILFTNKDKSKIYKTGLLNDDGLVQRGVLWRNRGADVPADELYYKLGAANRNLYCAGADFVAAAHEEDGRAERHELQHGQEQRESVCAVLGRH